MAKLPKDWLEKHKADLLAFIYASFQYRYYHGDVEKDDTPIGGEPSFEWEKHDWRYQDWFWGGEPFSGIIVISWRESPARDWVECWVMTVHGRLAPGITEHQAEGAYECLDEALKDAPRDRPFRGPGHHRTADGYSYYNYTTLARWLDHPDVDGITGTEFIQSPTETRLFDCRYTTQVINTLY